MYNQATMKIASSRRRGLLALLCLMFDIFEGSTERCGDNKAGINKLQLHKNLLSKRITVESYMNSTCTWLIAVPKDYTVMIALTQINSRFKINDCNKENFLIYDGNTTSDKEVVKYCASNKPESSVNLFLSGVHGRLVVNQGIPASPKKVFIVYAESKKENCNDGKRTKLKASPARHNFTSPNYPQPYPTGLTREWLIEAPGKKYIKLELVDMSYYFCKTASVKVYDGDKERPEDLIRDLCSERIDDIMFPKTTLFSKGQKLLVISTSSAYYQYPAYNKGFISFYTAVDKVTSCGVKKNGALIQLISDNGRIISPNYPSKHPSNLTCHWNLMVTKGEVIEITMASSFFTEDCSRQYVNIYDGLSSSSPLLAKLCYREDLKPLFSSANHITVEFVALGQSKGFLLSYKSRESKPKPYACENSKHKRIQNATSGKIASQRFPQFYLNYARCWFDIEVPKGSYIYLTFTSFDLGDNDNNKCVNDYVHVRSFDDFGVWKKSSVMCGKRKTPFSYISVTNKVTVYFESDEKGQHQGFEATYQRINYLPLKSSCGTNLLKQKFERSSGSITSYEFPLKYQNNVQCNWIISTTSRLYKFKLTIDFMDIEPSRSCVDDYVLIRDGTGIDGKSLGRFCGSNKPKPFKSIESSINVEFKTNGTGRYGGFKLSYEETYNWKGIVLIAACTILLFLGIVAFVVSIARRYFCKRDPYKGITTEIVDMKLTM